MIKISKRKSRKVMFHNRIANLFVCNFNGKITYKYVDNTDNAIRSKSYTDISSAVKDIRNEYKKREV